MTIFNRAARRPPERRRVVYATTVAALAAGSLAAGTTSASAAPESITDATFEWGINAEVQSAPPFGGCNYMSAGESDGTQATYLTSQGDVTVVKAGGEPTWATKCDGAASGAMDQKVVWSGGTGVVDSSTGEVSLAFEGQLSVSFYGGFAPFTIEDPVVTVDANGNGQVVATLFGYSSSMENPTEKFPLDPVENVVVADLSGVGSANDAGFVVTPDYGGVEYTPPAGSGGTPQNRTIPGWGSWPASFVDFHYETGLTSYWYSSGGAADSKKPPMALTVSYDGGPVSGEPQPGDDQQTITVTVPDGSGNGPGEFLWTIDAQDRAVILSSPENKGSFLQSTGEIKPVKVTDTRTGGPEWSISGQTSDFSGGLPGSYLGWSPEVTSPGAGAVAGDPVGSGLDGGDGISSPSVLAAATGGHDLGSATLGADLELRLPVDTEPGTYTSVLTITALS